MIQEESSTYHLFYGDRVGGVGTEITFFDWPHVGHGRTGARTVVRTDFAVMDDGALAWWRDRLAHGKIHYTAQQDFVGRNCLDFSDPDGQPLRIVAVGAFPAYQHWEANAATSANALQALHSVTLGVDQLEPTVRDLGDLFGYAVTKRFRSQEAHEGDAIALVVADNELEGGVESGIGKELIVVERTEAQPGLRGIGSIHHVALQIAPEDSIEAWHEQLMATGLKVTEIVRRYYFDSIYVRIPGGILFELATVTGPGLTADEPVTTLGQQLTLPPFLESQRAEIAAKLTPLVVPTPKIF